MVFEKFGICLKRFAAEETGATAIEYALIAGAITIGLAAVIFVLGETVAGKYQATADAFD